jgi:hypothetical protein
VQEVLLLEEAERQDVPSAAELTHVALQKRGLSSLGRGFGAAAHSLTSLDLSRNKIAVLDGFQALVSLKSLSLYFNHVAELSEATRLRDNRSLATLDMRLNSVTRLDGYRDRMLIELRGLTMLDKRAVSERERAMAVARAETAAPDVPPSRDAAVATQAAVQESGASLIGMMNDALLRAGQRGAAAAPWGEAKLAAGAGGSVLDGNAAARLALLLGGGAAPRPAASALAAEQQQRPADDRVNAAALAASLAELEERLAARIGALEPSAAMSETLSEMEARLARRIDGVAAAQRVSGGGGGSDSGAPRRGRPTNTPSSSSSSVTIAAIAGMEERLARRLSAVEAAVEQPRWSPAPAAPAPVARSTAPSAPPPPRAAQLSAEAHSQIEATLAAVLSAKLAPSLAASAAQIEASVAASLDARFGAMEARLEVALGEALGGKLDDPGVRVKVSSLLLPLHIRESCSQFDSLPLTSLTISHRAREARRARRLDGADARSARRARRVERAAAARGGRARADVAPLPPQLR